MIEDDEDDLFLVKELLTEVYGEQYELDWVQTWDLALVAIQAGKHDVCLLDNRLTKRTGLELVQEAVAAGCGIPLVLLTGQGSREVDLQAMRAGAADYLDKDKLNPAILDRAIRYSIVRHRMQRNRRAEFKGGAPRILLIEDDEDDFILTRSLLAEVRGADFTLDWVSNWEDAESRIAEGAHDVYLVDYRLGKRNGLELVEEWAGRGYTAPFILLTGQDSRDVDMEAMRIGAADYLVKADITGPLLDRAIRYALERNRGEQRLAEMAQFDQLTGLANRFLFREFLMKTLARSNRSHSSLAVMLLDLDRFKFVNDTFGHAAGDSLLKDTAQRLKDCVRASDLVARLGGDEFTVVVDGLTETDTIAHFGERILEALKDPFDVGGYQVFTSASIGIAVYPHDADNIEDLLTSADTAMYRAKELGANNFQFYTIDMQAKAAQYLHVERGLRRALEQEEFRLVYQPQLNLRSRRITGFEALLRWVHPEEGILAPDKFLPVAEDTGLIVPIGEWVLHTACSEAAKWQGMTDQPVSIAVNFSARQFQQRNLRKIVGEILDETKLLPSLLEIEVTENSILKDREEVGELLQTFAEMGLQVSLDDFGTGYSSLNHLKSFPGASIKIDQTFVENICSNQDDAAIVSAIIEMAHNLRLRVIAEGVESSDQLRFLAAQGCDAIQGYYFSRPISANRIVPAIFRKLSQTLAMDPLGLMSEAS